MSTPRVHRRLERIAEERGPHPTMSSQDEREPKPRDVERDLVVLLHGLARTRFSMTLLERALRRDGYKTLNVGYPSTRKAPHELVELLHDQLADRVGAVAREPGASNEVPVSSSEDAASPGDPRRVHFVTHSLGGVLLRAYLDRYRLPRLGRIVQLTPPNQGSEIVDRIGQWRLFGWIFGPTGRALGTTGDSLPQKLSAPLPAEVGVIAGSRSLNPVGKALLPGPGDGAVTLERTRFADGGEADWIALPIDHTTIMQRRATAEQVLHFLRHGRFDHAESSAT